MGATVMIATLAACLFPGSALAAGAVTFSFDDGHISTFDNALPVLEAHGLKGTANVVVDWILNRSDSMHVYQLSELQTRGWEIVSHSLTHPHFYLLPQTYADEVISGWAWVSGSTLVYKAPFAFDETPILIEDGVLLSKKGSVAELEDSPGSWYLDAPGHTVYVHASDSAHPSQHDIRADSVQRELEGSKIWLEESGLTIFNFAVPHSQWNWAMADLARAYYVSCASYSGPPPDYRNFNPIPPTQKRWLARIEIRRETTVAQVKAWVDEAISRNKWLILMFHAIGDYNDPWTWTSAKLDELAAYIKASGIKVVTQMEGLYLTSPPPEYPTFSLTANGLSGVYQGSSDELITIAMDLDPGSFDGETAEAWLAADLPWGSTVYYTPSQGWVDDPTPYGPYKIGSQTGITVWKSLLPWPGFYTFHVGVDEHLNGIIDNPNYRDSVTVEIR